VFGSERDAMQHDSVGGYQCPKCQGIGRVEGSVERTVHELDVEATGYGGQFGERIYRDRVVGYELVECEVCSGRGWTSCKIEPIVETSEKVVGWRPA